MLLKILISGFIPISIAIYFQLKEPLDTTWGESFGFFTGRMFFVFEYVFFPFILIWILTVAKEDLLDPKFKSIWGALYANIHIDNIGQRMYVHVFIIRRLLLLIIGLKAYGKPPLQLVAINIMNIAVIIYIGLWAPLKGIHEHKMDLFNEAMVALLTYFLFMFTDALPDKGA